MTQKRDLELLKTDYIGPRHSPSAIVTSYRTYTPDKNLYPVYKTVVLRGAYECIILDWRNETEARNGHNQVLARLKRGEPLTNMLT